MNIELICIGKTKALYLEDGIKEYTKRLRRFVNFKMTVIKDVPKQKSVDLLRKAESQVLKNAIGAKKHITLLDEGGKQFSSKEWSLQIEKLQFSHSNLVFLVGGAYGFDESIYQIATAKISLSKMTFSHQMIRLLFVEQLYRAYSIINHLPYHNEG